MNRLIAAAVTLAGCVIGDLASAATANLTAQPINTTDANGTIREVFCGLENQDSGYVKLPNRVNGHYFYWYFESRDEPSTDPLVLWLPGGPGEGGTYGLLAENGPCTVNDDLSTTLNPYSWTTNANMLWVDIPINSGFSYSTVEEDDEFTEERVDESVFWFLQGFFEKHPELQGRELFIVGESMGGHYVPSVANYIWQQQHEHVFKPGCSDLIPINLKGIAIGSGFTDPIQVQTHFGDMVVNNYNITLVNDTMVQAMSQATPQCQSMMVECQTNLSVCAEAYVFCSEALFSPLLTAHRNPYDIRQVCNASESDVLECLLKIPNLKAYLDSPNLRDYLGVSPDLGEWIMVNTTVNAAFFSAPNYSALMSIAPSVADLLEAGVRVLMYAGDADLVCNVYATEATADELEWSGSLGFQMAESRSYSTQSGITNAGRVRSYSRLTFVEVHNAGHMVPGDQPEVALDMINKFIRNEQF